MSAVTSLRLAALSTVFSPRRGVLIVCWGFSLWAIATVLQSDSELAPVGLAKAVELMLITGSAFFMALSLASRCDEQEVASVCAKATIACVILYLIENIAIWRTPFIMKEQAFMEGAGRVQLALGWNNPSDSGDLIGMAIIFSAMTGWSFRARAIAITGLGTLLWLCNARATTIGVVAGLAVIILARARKRRYAVVLLTLALLTAYAAYVLQTFNGNWRELVIYFIGADAFTLDGRVELWNVAFNGYLAHPISGVGYYQTRLYLLPYFDWAGHAHNSALEVLLGTGSVGGLFFAILTFSWLWTCVRTKSLLLNSVTPMLFIGSLVGPWEFSPNMQMFFLIAILVYARNRVARNRV
jgi:O-antigen ligase